MANARAFFRLLRYAQHLCISVAVYYGILFVWRLFEHEPQWGALNLLLVYAGVALILSTLQETQTDLFHRIGQSPMKVKVFLGFMGTAAAAFFLAGIAGSMAAPNTPIRDIAVGCILMSVGMMNQVKVASEHFASPPSDQAGQTPA